MKKLVMILAIWTLLGLLFAMQLRMDAWYSGHAITVTQAVILSLSGWYGWALLSPYVASKGALQGLTRAWAREFGPYGITVNAVAPGAFPTDAEKIHPDPEGYTRFVLERQAVKRRGVPDDMDAGS